MFRMQKEAASIGMIGNVNEPQAAAQEPWQGAE